MTTYNPNDFYPRSGTEIDSQGNVKNDADGINTDGSKNVLILKHKQTTIQTHNAVSVAANNYSIDSSWRDSDGFDKIAGTIINDAALSSTMYVYWSNDGVNTHSLDVLIATGTGQQRSGIMDTRARYYKIQINNNDTIAHTMSAWAYLKA